MTITNNPAAVAYAKQIGVPTGIGANIDLSGTVSELYTRAKEVGLRVTTKMRKDELTTVIQKFNRQNAETVDLSKLTPAQRRRLRKKFGIR